MRGIFIIIALFTFVSHSQAQERVTPLAWTEKIVSSTRDSNSNFIEDSLEDKAQFNPDGLEAIVALNKCLSYNDIQKYNKYGDITYISRLISSISISNLDLNLINELAQEPEVSFIFEDRNIKSNLGTSNQSIRVRESAEHTPDTIEELYPNLYTFASNIGIAILDSGVDEEHVNIPSAIAYFDARIGREINPDDQNGHGTHVAGIALGRINNDQIPGICRTCNLIDVAVTDANGKGSNTWIQRGLEWVYENRHRYNIRVANLSLSGEISDGLDPLSQTVNRLSLGGVSVVASIGNDSNEGIPTPAAADEAFSISSANERNTVDNQDDMFSADHSNFGPRTDDGDSINSDELKPELAAPGFLIEAPEYDTANGITDKTGTSMASPHVAGVVGLISGLRPGITPRSIREIIRSSNQTWDPELGYGIIDAHALMQVADQLVATDLGFSEPCGVTPRSSNLSAQSEPIFLNQQNGVSAEITNFGGQTSSQSTIKVGLYKFGTSERSWDICEQNIPELDPGETFSVSCNWSPQISGHACLKADLSYGHDTNYFNNCAQRNVDILSIPFGSSKSTFLEVVHDNSNDTEIVATIDASNDEWNIVIPEEFQKIFMYPTECPRIVNVEVSPKSENSSPVTIDIVYEYEKDTWPGIEESSTVRSGISIFASVAE